MTDNEKIEKLAKFMGWHKLKDENKSLNEVASDDNTYFLVIEDDYIGLTCLYCRQHVTRAWNPLVNIADAWMLVEKLRADDWIVIVKEMPKDLCHIIQGSVSEYDAPSDNQYIEKGKASCELSCGRQEGEYRRSRLAFATSAARAISEAVLEVIE